jgi:hypothetical protein
MLAGSALKKQPRSQPTSQASLGERAKPRLFHARMVVTRIEEWCIKAATAEEAEALLASGAGYRCTPGESIQVELERLIDE